jgi:hypothetical protein
MPITRNAQAATLERLKLVTGPARTGCAQSIRFYASRQTGGQRDASNPEVYLPA